jgi:hypothetical protein
MADDRPLDYRTACIRQAARAVKAEWMGYRSTWSVTPLAGGCGIDDEQWLGRIAFNKAVQAHHLHAIALRGCVAELQFRPETLSHPYNDVAVSKLFPSFVFTDSELDMMSLYCTANSIQPHQILDIKLYTGMWHSILKEAREGRDRDRRDLFRPSW